MYALNKFLLQVTFLWQIHIRKFEELMADVLLEVISDIHSVFWINADPVDVRNDFQQDTRSQAFISSNFL